MAITALPRRFACACKSYKLQYWLTVTIEQPPQATKFIVKNFKLLRLLLWSEGML
jgi:hypothetical protein